MASSEEKLITAISKLTRGLKDSGVRIKRERLTKGAGFRVRSGLCSLNSESVLFVDKNLSPDQQLSVMVDYALDSGRAAIVRQINELPANLKALIEPAEAAEASA